jgi:putative colanic acid biosynthesis acetyltransferase WcaF
MNKVNNASFNNDWYDVGRSRLVTILWYFTNILFFINPLNPISSLKVFLLRLFGAKIGKGVLIKPCVNIKYPWKLSIDDYSWVGENVWIDNLNDVSIGKNVCISQGAMLLTGNHNYKKTTFDLMIGTITLEEGSWIGAKSLVGPNVVCKSHSILAINSVTTQDLEPYIIYQGNPAQKVRQRIIN